MKALYQIFCPVNGWNFLAKELNEVHSSYIVHSSRDIEAEGDYSWLYHIYDQSADGKQMHASAEFPFTICTV